MSGRELFGVILRTLGALFALLGIYTTAFGLLDLLGFYLPSGASDATEFVFGGMEFVVGLLILMGSNFIVRLSYGNEPKPSPKPVLNM